MTTSRPSETLQLLRQWHGGDRAALIDLVRRNLGWVHRFVRRHLDATLRNRLDSVDLVQDAMVQVLEHGPQFELRDESHFRALLGRIVTNDIQDHHRRVHRKKRDQARERPLTTDSVLYLDQPARTVTRPHQNAERTERMAWVRLGIKLMDPEDREVLQMRQWEDASFADIGKHLSVSEDAARMRYHRALKRLGDKVIALRTGSVARFLEEAGDLD